MIPEPDADEERPWTHRAYRAAGIGLRLYVLSLAVAGIYSLLWIAEIAGYLDERMLGTIWLAITAMGACFVIVLVPLFYVSR